MRSIVAVLLLAGAFYSMAINAMLYRFSTYRPLPGRREEKFLTHHLGAGQNMNVESRYRRLPSEPFYRGIQMLYANRVLRLPETLPLDIARAEPATGFALQFGYFVATDDFPFDRLLDEAVVGFLYNPMAFCGMLRAKYHVRAHRDYSPPWEAGYYPLMIVLLEPSKDPAVAIVSVRFRHYLFLVPEDHPVVQEYVLH